MIWQVSDDFDDRVRRMLQPDGGNPPAPDPDQSGIHSLNDLIIKISHIIPQELVGFVLAIALVLTVLLLYFLLKMLKPDETRLNKARRKKNAQKTRALALASGFMADNVERDIPDISSDGNSYVMARGECQRYTLPQIMRTKAEWRVVCRPGDVSEGFSLPGWKLEIFRGEMSDEYRVLLAEVVQAMADPGEFFEMEVTHQALYFYWYENGGRQSVEKLISAVRAISDMT